MSFIITLTQTQHFTKTKIYITHDIYIFTIALNIVDKKLLDSRIGGSASEKPCRLVPRICRSDRNALPLNFPLQRQTETHIYIELRQERDSRFPSASRLRKSSQQI